MRVMRDLVHKEIQEMPQVFAALPQAALLGVNNLVDGIIRRPIC